MSNIGFHPENKEIPTYKQGSDQIDTIIASNDIIPYITQRGILKFDRLCFSDHSALFIDIDLRRYIKGA